MQTVKSAVKQLVKRKLRERFYPFEVIVHWYGVRFHLARNYDDALAWASAVPRSGAVFIRNRFTGELSARYASDV